MRWKRPIVIVVILKFMLLIEGATDFFDISFDDVRSFFNQTSSAPRQKTATVSESSEIYIEYQTESGNDPHVSRDFDSVERAPGYTVSEDISVDTGQGISPVLKGELIGNEFITSTLEKAIALEARYYPEVLRPVEEMNSDLQDLKVKFEKLARDSGYGK